MKKIVAVTAILMVVVACSPQSPAVEPKDTASVEELNPADYTRDQGASAELDRETGEITLPLNSTSWTKTNFLQRTVPQYCPWRDVCRRQATQRFGYQQTAKTVTGVKHNATVAG